MDTKLSDSVAPESASEMKTPKGVETSSGEAARLGSPSITPTTHHTPTTHTTSEPVAILSRNQAVSPSPVPTGSSSPSGKLHTPPPRLVQPLFKGSKTTALRPIHFKPSIRPSREFSQPAQQNSEQMTISQQPPETHIAPSSAQQSPFSPFTIPRNDASGNGLSTQPLPNSTAESGATGLGIFRNPFIANENNVQGGWRRKNAEIQVPVFAKASSVPAHPQTVRTQNRGHGGELGRNDNGAQVPGKMNNEAKRDEPGNGIQEAPCCRAESNANACRCTEQRPCCPESHDVNNVSENCTCGLEALYRSAHPTQNIPAPQTNRCRCRSRCGATQAEAHPCQYNWGSKTARTYHPAAAASIMACNCTGNSAPQQCQNVNREYRNEATPAACVPQFNNQERDCTCGMVARYKAAHPNGHSGGEEVPNINTGSVPPSGGSFGRNQRARNAALAANIEARRSGIATLRPSLFEENPVPNTTRASTTAGDREPSSTEPSRLFAGRGTANARAPDNTISINPTRSVAGHEAEDISSADVPSQLQRMTQNSIVQSQSLFWVLVMALLAAAVACLVSAYMLNQERTTWLAANDLIRKRVADSL